MQNMAGSSKQAAESTSESHEKQSKEWLGPEGSTCGVEPKKTLPKIDECLEAYVTFGTVSKAAEYLQVREEKLQRRLQQEAKRQGLSDIRMLIGGQRSIEQAKLNRSYLVALIEEQGYRCKLSGIELTPETAALDHIVPVSKGGQHCVGNVAWVHEEINRMKGPLSVEEFVAMCLKVVQYTR
jgi:hypothetical protein